MKYIVGTKRNTVDGYSYVTLTRYKPAFQLLCCNSYSFICSWGQRSLTLALLLLTLPVSGAPTFSSTATSSPLTYSHPTYSTCFSNFRGGRSWSWIQVITKPGEMIKCDNIKSNGKMLWSVSQLIGRNEQQNSWVYIVALIARNYLVFASFPWMYKVISMLSSK